MFLCFIDYSKAFHTVAHDILWNDMHKIGFPTHILLLNEWFEIGQGVRQGCIISPHHFNIYAEAIMRNALENFEGNITVESHKITNLRYADDVVLIAGSLEELQDLVDRVRLESEKVGLFLNTRKQKLRKLNNIHQTVEL